MTALPMPAIDDELQAFLEHGPSLVLAAAGEAGVPDLGVALGCLVARDRQRLAVVLRDAAAAPLLALLQAGCERVALVASRPTDLRTVQVKGVDATLRPGPPDADEYRRVERSLAALRGHFAAIGRGDAYVSAVLQHVPGELRVVEFRPTDVFEQTPGPQAGRRRPGAP